MFCCPSTSEATQRQTQQLTSALSSSRQVQQQQQQRYRGSDDPSKTAVIVKLYNRCSRGFLQTFYKTVNANGKYDSPLSDIKIQTDSLGGRVRLLSNLFKKYICFDRRARLIVRLNGRSSRCVFVERMTESQLTEFESAALADVWLAFGPRGRALPQRRRRRNRRRRRRCLQFLRIKPSTRLANATTTTRPDVWADKLAEHFLDRFTVGPPSSNNATTPITPPPPLLADHRRRRRRRKRPYSRRHGRSYG